VQMDLLMLLVVIAFEQKHLMIENMYQHFVQQHVKNFENYDIICEMIDMYYDIENFQVNQLMLHEMLKELYHLLYLH
jgi:hypothetical protein